jgi:ABC-2 type transport system permease protein
MTGLLKLTWVETKIFLREPLGVIGSVLVPLMIFIAVSGTTAPGPAPERARVSGLDPSFAPALSSMMLALGAVTSLVAIVSIYREGGILKRLRATPLQPLTILTAHVVVKLLFTFVSVMAMALMGRRYFPSGIQVHLGSFVGALMVTTFCVLSIGFLVASVVPTARFAQPLATMILYPMLAVSGLFFPIDALPGRVRTVAHAMPLAAAVSFLRGAWTGEPWTAHVADLAVLVLTFAVCTALSARVFRWE